MIAGVSRPKRLVAVSVLKGDKRVVISFQKGGVGEELIGGVRGPCEYGVRMRNFFDQTTTNGQQ